ncbi:MAG TPA: hypothetical protein VME46_15165 [Acidimicrobiales bacterium]|nr:hypothetical protein [Acidimicrobiales bacterium]
MSDERKAKPASLRPAGFILLTLVLAAPTLANILQGADSAMSAGVHLGAAILVSWVAMGIVGYLVDSYRLAVARRSQHAQPGPSQH